MRFYRNEFQMILGREGFYTISGQSNDLITSEYVQPPISRLTCKKKQKRRCGYNTRHTDVALTGRITEYEKVRKVKIFHPCRAKR